MPRAAGREAGGAGAAPRRRSRARGRGARGSCPLAGSEQGREGGLGGDAFFHGNMGRLQPRVGAGEGRPGWGSAGVCVKVKRGAGGGRRGAMLAEGSRGPAGGRAGPVSAPGAGGEGRRGRTGRSWQAGRRGRAGRAAVGAGSRGPGRGGAEPGSPLT